MGCRALRARPSPPHCRLEGVWVAALLPINTAVRSIASSLKYDPPPPPVVTFHASQLYTIHDITCGPAFKAAALDLLAAAEAEVDEGLEQQTEPVIMALETLR